MAQFWRAAALAFAWSISVVAWAQSDTDVVARGEALVRAGNYAEAYKLLEPLEDRLAGNLKFDYLLARSALESGQPSKASFIYERILAVEPNYVGVRLEMGRAYFALGDVSRAKLEFETVLRFQNLPSDLRQQAQIYDKAANEYLEGKKTVGHAYLEYGYGYDSNPQSATRISPIAFIDVGTLPVAPPEGDQYHSLTLGGELVHALSNKFSIFAGVDARARQYTDLSAADWSTVDGRAGLGYNNGVHNVRFALTGGRFWLDKLQTRDSGGATLDYRYLAGKQDQVTFGLSGSRNKFVPDALKINSYDLYQISLGWLHGAADGRGAAGVTLLGGVENELNGRVDGDKPFVGARLSLQRALTGSVGAFLLAGAQYGKYSDLNPLFVEKRVDTLYDVTAGMSWTFAKGWSVRPQVLYMKNRSNLPLYEYERTDVSLNLRVDI